MKIIISLLTIYFLQIQVAFAAENCEHSHSWQCQGHQSHSSQGSHTSTGIASGGQTPDNSLTNPHLGSTSTSTVPR